jgi:two-component system, chemotaxis family, sensor kinase Cph1
VTSSNRLPPADLADCADEPIRVPGAIQPHGRLVVVDRDRGALVAYSANFANAEQARAAVVRLAAGSAQLQVGDAPSGLGGVDLGGEWVQASAHVTGQFVVYEFESSRPDAGAQAPIYSLARQFLPALQRAGTLMDMAELAVGELKRLTGFGRCLLYRFDAHDHGEVLAEQADPGYETYLGHRFPAADIPAQARELYRLNHIRLIPDARYRPVDLLCVDAGRDPRSIDLSLAALRSVSPVHLEYMRNMGTLASMSVSIVVRGRLWGLISCHDHAPRDLGFSQRVACEHLGRLLSMQIEAKEETGSVATRLQLRQLTIEIVGHLVDSDASLQALVREPVPLLRLADATGAAVVHDDQCWTVGDVPPRAQIDAISDWVGAQQAPVVHTACLAADCPAGAGSAAAAGVLALSISQVHRHHVIWFRPEVVETIRWAGEPAKPVRAGDGRIHPRRSFASWMELVRDRSPSWQSEQLAEALELRQALIGIVLRRAEEMAQVATELGRVNKELEAFSYTVSHDLRAPMRHIAGYVGLVLDADGAQLSERGRRYLKHAVEAAAYAGHLVDALLDFSRMGRAALKPASVDVETLVGEICNELARQDPARAVQWQVDGPLPRLWADPFLLQVVLRNLLGNAWKYTRRQAQPLIRVSALERPDGSGLEVSDNGVGFQMKYVHKLFGVFQRLHHAEDYDGTGIGLASVRRIVERHGGTVWARGEPDRGATFGFVLPDPPAPA